MQCKDEWVDKVPQDNLNIYWRHSCTASLRHISEYCF